MGAKQILDAILADANAEAKSVLADAQESVLQTKQKALAAARAEVDAIAAKTDAEAAETEKRRLLTAGIEARKNTLASKRALLDEAFTAAVASLSALEPAPYAALVTGLVAAGAETGREQLKVPAAHRDRFEKPYLGGKTLLALCNEALKKAGKPGELTLCAEPARFTGGALLVGADTDVDCSFEALVASYRDAHEAEVYSLLFTEE